MRAYLTFAQGQLDGETVDPDTDVFDRAELELGPYVLGGKGHNLAAMAARNLPVPPGFVISTQVCKVFERKPDAVLAAIGDDLAPYLQHIRNVTGVDCPMVSVRSGAPVSMPGMMDTVLNVGLTEETLPYWVNRIGPKAAWDCRRRLYQMYGEIVCEVPKADMAIAEHNACAVARVASPRAMTAQQLFGLCQRYKNVMAKHGHTLPETLEGQLIASIAAVFRSWNSERAIKYRALNNIADDMGTAVIVQAMVFGNMNDASATGVVFTRNPSTGENRITGELLVNAQGEDVVSGAVTPLAFNETGTGNVAVSDFVPPPVLAAVKALCETAALLDATLGDMQDIEFTVENGKLWLLQTRDGKRSAAAAFAIARDQLAAKVWTAEQALDRLTLAQYKMATRPQLDEADTLKRCTVLGTGLVGSTGVAVGRMVLTEESAAAFIAEGHPVILFAHETNPEDISIMAKCAGILTATGGTTSHAAVVARGMDKVCITGCKDLKVAPTEVSIGAHTVLPGDWITLDGCSGVVYAGKGTLTATASSAVEDVLRALAVHRGISLRSARPGTGVWYPAGAVRHMQGALALCLALETVTDEEAATMVLDLTVPQPVNQDSAFMAAMGAPEKYPAYEDVAGCVLQANKSGRKFTILRPEKFPSATLEKQLTDAGNRFVAEVTTLEAALTAEAPIILSSEMKALLGGPQSEMLVQAAALARGARIINRGVSLGQVAALLFS